MYVCSLFIEYKLSWWKFINSSQISNTIGTTLYHLNAIFIIYTIIELEMPVASQNELVFFVSWRRLNDHMQSVKIFHKWNLYIYTMKRIHKYFNDDLSILYRLGDTKMKQLFYSPTFILYFIVFTSVKTGCCLFLQWQIYLCLHLISTIFHLQREKNNTFNPPINYTTTMLLLNK